jgi:hypothetical protein
VGSVVRQGKRIEVETIETAVPAPRRRTPTRETFARIPHKRGMELYGRIHGAAWIILLELDRLIFKSFGRNPVRFRVGNTSTGTEYSGKISIFAARDAENCDIALIFREINSR